MLSIERCARGGEEERGGERCSAGKEEGIYKICKENNLKAVKKNSKNAKKERKRERDAYKRMAVHPYRQREINKAMGSRTIDYRPKTYVEI